MEAEFVVDGVVGRNRYLSDSSYLLRISYPITKLTLLGLGHLNPLAGTLTFLDALANIKTVKLVISKEDRSLNIKDLERYFMSDEMKSMTANFRSSLPTIFELDF